MKKLKHWWGILYILIFVNQVVLAQKKQPSQITVPNTEATYLRVPLKKAMTAADLLTLYCLNKSACNQEKFLALNKISKLDTKLKLGANYNLPILVYPFDGKTIRTSLKNNDLPLARRIDAFNKKLYTLKLRPQTIQESKTIWVAMHELNCGKNAKKQTPKTAEEGDTPPSVSTTSKDDTSPNSMYANGEKAKSFRTYAIFGKKYERVPLVSNKLKNKIFYIESGHGGPDPGARATLKKRTLCEDEYAYDVSLRVARNLISLGATVFIITRDPNDGIRDGEFLLCDKDEQTYPNQIVPAPPKERLFQRSDAINELYDKYEKKGIKDQRLMVIHVDSRNRKEQTDLFLYYKDGDDESKRLATNIRTNLENRYKKFRDYNGTVTMRDLHMLRECKTHTVFIELGNIHNPTDQKRIMLAKNRQIIADWLTEGFIK
jgi:N-acetylmuramoyl-L-alanine amidase